MTFDPLHRWTEAEPWLERALDLRPPERQRVLDTIDDPDLRQQVARLLEVATDQERAESEPLSMVLHTPSPGIDEQIGPYRLIEILGEGGMASVFLAEREGDSLHQRVALKVLRVEALGPETPTQRHRRFRAEGQFLAGLDHPGIARVLDSGIDSGRAYLALELIDGLPITEHCRQRQLPLDEVLGLFVEVCGSLQYAHRRLIVHRDLKPSNLLVTTDGQPKLLDFGIAKLLAPSPSETELTAAIGLHTGAGQRLLTPDYAAPEQYRGNAVTTATDIWGLGVLLYELLTGRRPFDSREFKFGELEREVCESEPPRPSRVIEARPANERPPWTPRALKGDLDTIVAKAIAKEPERRYESVAELAADLRRFLAGQPIAARPATLTYRLGKLLRRNPIASTASFVTSLVIGSLILGLALQQRQTVDERNRAQRHAERAESVTEFLLTLFDASDPGVHLGEESTARELLEAGLSRVDELDTSALLQARMLDTIGSVFQSLANPERAIELLERSVASYRGVLASDITAAERLEAEDGLALALNHLGDALLAATRSEEARDAFLEAMAIQQRAGPNEGQRLYSLNALGVASEQLAEHDQARHYFDQALEIPDDALATELLPTRISTLNDAGAFLAKRGNHLEALQLLRRALDLSRKTYGERNPLTTQAMSRLGDQLSRLDRHAEAAPLLEQAARIQKEIYGPDHYLYGQILNSLALSLRRVGRYEEAIEALEGSLAAYQAAYGERHLAASILGSSLCFTQLFVDRVDAAIAHCEESYTIAVEALGNENNRYAANALSMQGLAYELQGDLDATGRAWSRALSIHRRLEPEGADVAELESLTGRLLYVQGELDAAKERLEGAGLRLERLYGPDHSTTLMARYVRHLTEAALAERNGDPKGADAARHASVSTWAALEPHLPPGHIFRRWLDHQAEGTATGSGHPRSPQTPPARPKTKF